mmetsp:Transcript_68224/g.108291  ORF Transcript_68224/g.108291 Transcript_68224/m.108291 type:complete len:91 (-) Transcript_68224:76-348(-)
MDLNAKRSALSVLLSACQMHNDLKRAERTFKEIQDEFLIHLNKNEVMDKQIAAAYVSMSNIYAQNEQYDKKEQLRNEMSKRGMTVSMSQS